MRIFVFGNEDLKIDSLPLKLLPKLRELFPTIEFVEKDPNEEWSDTENMFIIDTVIGVNEITIFDDLKSFVRTPRFSLHDFDAYTNLVFLEKLGKIKKIKIVGVPPTISEIDALNQISTIIRSSLL